jgi:CheY-like chemotaxis protein
MLKKFGIMTEVVSNGLEAISALEEQSYDLVLMDIQMPKMNGIEATKVICERWPQRPKIIVISDCDPNLYRDLCFDAGAIEFLAKPVKIKEICTAIERNMPEKQDDLPQDVQPCL